MLLLLFLSAAAAAGLRLRARPLRSSLLDEASDELVVEQRGEPPERAPITRMEGTPGAKSLPEPATSFVAALSTDVVSTDVVNWSVKSESVIEAASKVSNWYG